MACGSAPPTDTPPPAAAAASTPDGPAPPQARTKVEPDPDFLEALGEAAFSTFGWDTDFSLHTIDYGEIFSGGVGRDGIPPIDNPMFESVAQVNEWLAPLEPVIALEVDGVAKAYPLQILTRHEIVNDEIGGVPVAITFCPLCNSAIVFDRRLNGVVYDFGVSGNLRNSDLIMWDRQTQSWWQQLTGEGIVGALAGERLTFIPAQLVAWKTYAEAYPTSEVLSRETGFRIAYGTNPYVGYDRLDQRPFLFDGEADGRLQPMERVAAVAIGDAGVAFPFRILAEERVVNYRIGGRDIAVFYEPGARSALDARVIASAREVGATGVFDPVVDGMKLTFAFADDGGGRIVDEETGSTWSILGEAVAGPLEGTKLGRVVHSDHFWFAWAAFHPDTVVYGGATE
ncbi:MAG: DUF3179 domain-containing protein [Chloroflexi bacterium]|nr:DUF3179 domain-containing protein [Chloroflexota bacterium]